MEYTNEKPLKVITLCSGYDSQCLALERLKTVYPEFDYELIAWSEFEPESKTPLNKQPAVTSSSRHHSSTSDNDNSHYFNHEFNECEL